MTQVLFRRPVVIILFLQIAAILFFDVSGLSSGGSTTSDFAISADSPVVGIVSGDPEPRLCRSGSRILWYIPFRTEHGCLEKVLWFSPTWQKSPKYGEKWEMVFKEKGGHGTVYSTSLADADGSSYISSGHGNIIQAFCYKGRREAAALLAYGIDEHSEAVAILHSVLLGYRSSFPRELRELFCSTGTLHIFAISGLHVSIIALLITVLLRYCGVSRLHWVYFLAPMLIAYTIATGGRASSVRACIMMILLYLGPVLSRKSDVLSALALSAALILLFSPAQLYNIGFIFSYVVVTGIVMICPLIEKPLQGLIEPDPLRMQPEGRAVTLLRSLAGRLMTLVSVSIAAWISSAPLSMFFFQRFTPAAVVSNVLVVPLALLVVVTGCLSLLLGSCITLASLVLNHMNLAFIWLLLKLIALLSRLPGGSIDTREIPLAMVVAWYLLLSLLVLLYRRRCSEKSLFAPEGGGEEHSYCEELKSTEKHAVREKHL